MTPPNLSPFQILVPELGMTTIPMTCCANFGLYSVRYNMNNPSSIGHDYQKRLQATVTRLTNEKDARPL